MWSQVRGTWDCGVVDLDPEQGERKGVVRGREVGAAVPEPEDVPVVPVWRGVWW